MLGCSKDDTSAEPQTYTDTYTVAVVVPGSGGAKGQWKSTVDWALENIEKAQQSCSNKVQLKVEMYDEETEDMEELGTKLGKREDVRCVIGPVNQSRLEVMAAKIKGKNKPLIAINAGGTDVVRNYVEKRDFFWALTNTDIYQSEVITASGANAGKRRFSLVYSENSLTGKTFKDMFDLQLTLFSLENAGTFGYSDPSAIPAKITECMQGVDNKSAILLAPNDEQEACTMLKELNTLLQDKSLEETPYIYMNNEFINMDVSDLDLAYAVIFAIPSADPSSGFYNAFYSRTGKTLNSFEAQLYDALMLTAMALANDATDLKASLIEITSKEGNELYAWNVENMSTVFGDIERKSLNYHIAGASSKLMMDVDNHTCVTFTHYLIGYLYDNTFTQYTFYSPYKDGTSSSSQSVRKWRTTTASDCETASKEFNYPTLHERWAVLVAASEGFENYRHQADVLNMYQYLRGVGFPDDHILLIMEDDIANSPDNKKSGEIRVDANENNLYHDIALDYHVHDLKAQQVLDRIAQMPFDADDNVFIFWSGHGSPKGMMWSESECVTPSMLRHTMESLQGRYRKMMWCVETCYSGRMRKAVEGLPGVIMLTAANENEPSKAYNYNDELGVWMSNRFSIYLIDTFIQALAKRGDISIREMYYYLVVNTIGSHVMLYNSTNYGNITEVGFKEYF